MEPEREAVPFSRASAALELAAACRTMQAARAFVRAARVGARSRGTAVARPNADRRGARRATAERRAKRGTRRRARSSGTGIGLVDSDCDVSAAVRSGATRAQAVTRRGAARAGRAAGTSRSTGAAARSGRRRRFREERARSAGDEGDRRAGDAAATRGAATEGTSSDLIDADWRRIGRHHRQPPDCADADAKDGLGTRRVSPAAGHAAAHQDPTQPQVERRVHRAAGAVQLARTAHQHQRAVTAMSTFFARHDRATTTNVERRLARH